MAITANDYVNSGNVTDLINAIKTEFLRRANPYNETSLVNVANSLTVDPLDAEGSYSLWDTYQKALADLDSYYKYTIALNTDGYLSTEDLNMGYQIVNEFASEDFEISSTLCNGSC